MLTCNTLSLKRGYKTIFSNLSLTLLEGACLLVNGRNGSGKTSFLKTVAGILKPKLGSLLFHNTPIKEMLDYYLAQLLYISDQETLNENLTIAQNLNFWANLYDTNIILPAAMYTFSIEKHANTLIKNLSKGTKKKVILSRLLLSQASIWLLDEPLVNLDNMSIEILYNIIAMKCSQGGIVIITTHQPTKLNTPLILNIEDYS